jgi:hypothetical protein
MGRVTGGHSSATAHRRRLRKLDLNEGLHLEIEWSAQFIDFVPDWCYDPPNILELRIEDMVTEPFPALGIRTVTVAFVTAIVLDLAV